MISKIALGISVLALLVAGFLWTRPSTPMSPMHNPPLGASGSDFFSQVGLMAGVVNSGSISTTSQGSVTVTANEFIGWANAGLVSFSPGLLAGATVTLPASSTLSSMIPRPGDRQSFCIQNSTSTVGVVMTFAGALGTKFLVASSSATALGSTKLTTGKIGCFTLIREVATSSPWGDIDALYTAFQ